MDLNPRSAFLRTAIRDWTARGLLTPDQSAALERDVSDRTTNRSFSGFVILAGVLCLIFGAISFVAANWDAMARIVRVAVILTGLWLAWGGSAWARLTGRTWLGACLTLLACGLCGAGIMLISQMYHLQGEPSDAVFLWTLATVAAAILTGSTPALILGLGLLCTWHFMDTINAVTASFNLLYLPIWALCAGLALWLRNRVAGHAAAFALCFWVITELYDEDVMSWAIMPLIGVIFAAVTGGLASFAGSRILRGFEPAALAYLLSLAGLALAPLYVTSGDMELAPGMAGWAVFGAAAAMTITGAIIGQRQRWRTSYDLWVTPAMLALVAVAFFLRGGPPASFGAHEAALLALSIWGVRLGYRLDSRLLTAVGGIWFAVMMMAIYAKTLGSLLSTSVFYLGAGILLLLGAFLATRLRRAARCSGGDG